MRRSLRFLIATMCLLLCEQQIQAVNPQHNAQSGNMLATPVTGESWLNHLHRSFGDTSMGKTGRLGPPAPDPDAEALASRSVVMVDTWPSVVTLHGSDLYRLNCRACHGEAGLGAPPEINSVINPVRATSVSLVLQRMKSTGMDITPAAATELAKQSKAALLQRLHNGGENMPPFPHLSEEETRALLGYLNTLAGVPGAHDDAIEVKETRLRVGEHIVKSTCHICHSATGANPDYQQLEDGAIPPLDTLTMRVNEVEFIRKVTSGAPIVMGTPATPHRGRMPVFGYLSREEAADVYLYLTEYPPTQVASDTTIALLQQNPSQPGGPSATGGSGGSAGSPLASDLRGDISRPTQGPDLKAVAFLSALGAFVIALLAGGLAFTLREFKRLSAKAERGRIVCAEASHSHRQVADLVTQ